jgi:hypothetical protein
MTKILHSMYLSREYRSFAKIQHNLFVYGLSFGENDQHWFDLIRRGRMRVLYVSLYGDPYSETNLHIRTRATQISLERSARRPLEVMFYDAASAHVWVDVL